MWGQEPHQRRGRERAATTRCLPPPRKELPSGEVHRFQRCERLRREPKRRERPTRLAPESLFKQLEWLRQTA